MEKEFEKLWLELKNTNYKGLVDVAIANCPDDWSFCSFIASAGAGNFVHLILDREETEKIRDALTKIIDDMPCGAEV